MTQTATIQRPTRFNNELWRKETYCHNHWWQGDYCYYGAHYLNEEPQEVKEVEQAAPQPEEQPVATGTIHDGYYTVSLDGDKHRTFRLSTQPDDAHFAPGKQVIAFLGGSDNQSDYVNFGFVINGQVALWRRFTHGYQNVIDAAKYLLSGNHEEAGQMYAQESKNCYICNRLLTTPESVAAGIGPTCASKVA